MPEISCTICLGHIEVPVAIPCGHVFCEECLASYITHSNGQAGPSGEDVEFALCPTCRTPFWSASMPDMKTVPIHVQDFLLPPLRKLYFSESSTTTTNTGSSSSCASSSPETAPPARNTARRPRHVLSRAGTRSQHVSCSPTPPPTSPTSSRSPPVTSTPITMEDMGRFGDEEAVFLVNLLGANEALEQQLAETRRALEEKEAENAELRRRIATLENPPRNRQTVHHDPIIGDFGNILHDLFGTAGRLQRRGPGAHASPW